MWFYNKQEFTDEMIPKNAVGFIYVMSAVIDGKKRHYIGKKNFYADVKTKLNKKELSEITDNRLKKYKRIKRTTYKNYYSSNDEIKKAKADGIEIRRMILKICYSKAELTYQEVRYMFKLDVLENDVYLNSNILGKFYKQK